MRIYLLRHGETNWNRERRLQGQKGADINEDGIRMAEYTAEGMRGIPFDLCYSSPLERAMHTTRIVLDGRDVPVVVEPRLMEISFGIWEGKTIHPDHPEIPLERFNLFQTDPLKFEAFEQGESVHDVIARCGAFYRELIAKESLKDATILLSTHGCASRSVLYSCLEDKSSFWRGTVPPNCSVCVLDVRDGKTELVEKDIIYYPEEYRKTYYRLPENSYH